MRPEKSVLTIRNAKISDPFPFLAHHNLHVTRDPGDLCAYQKSEKC